MQQSASWEANRFAASQEIPRILWNPEVHYRIHKCPPPVPIMSRLDSDHTLTSHFLKIHLKIILPSTSASPKCLLSFTVPHQHPVHAYPLSHTRYMPHPSHSSPFYHPKKLDKQQRPLRSTVWMLLHSPVNSFLFGPNILLNPLFSNTLSLRSSLNLSDQVSHPYFTNSNICCTLLFFSMASH
jgi:hypothetical protein